MLKYGTEYSYQFMGRGSASSLHHGTFRPVPHPGTDPADAVVGPPHELSRSAVDQLPAVEPANVLDYTAVR
jgi:hypothetical protein